MAPRLVGGSRASAASDELPAASMVMAPSVAEVMTAELAEETLQAITETLAE